MVTRQFHADVDEPWLDLMRPSVSRSDYFAQLVRTYGLVAPFESACKYTPRLERVLEFGRLSRAGFIAQDLLVLGLSASELATIPQCRAITMFKDVAEAAGWLYVVERATLLRRNLRRHLLRRIPEINDACAYLAAFDQHDGDHWSSFGRMLDRIGSRPDSAREMMATAEAGFASVKHWFRSSQPATIQ